MKKLQGSQSKLKKDVLEQSLCTGCGACVGLCPYHVIYADRMVQLFDCEMCWNKAFAPVAGPAWGFAPIMSFMPTGRFSFLTVICKTASVTPFVRARPPTMEKFGKVFLMPWI